MSHICFTKIFVVVLFWIELIICPTTKQVNLPSNLNFTSLHTMQQAVDFCRAPRDFRRGGVGRCNDGWQSRSRRGRMNGVTIGAHKVFVIPFEIILWKVMLGFANCSTCLVIFIIPIMMSTCVKCFIKLLVHLSVYFTQMILVKTRCLIMMKIIVVVVVNVPYWWCDCCSFSCWNVHCPRRCSSCTSQTRHLILLLTNTNNNRTI